MIRFYKDEGLPHITFPLAGLRLGLKPPGYAAAVRKRAFDDVKPAEASVVF